MVRQAKTNHTYYPLLYRWPVPEYSENGNHNMPPIVVRDQANTGAPRRAIFQVLCLPRMKAVVYSSYEDGARDAKIRPYLTLRSTSSMFRRRSSIDFCRRLSTSYHGCAATIKAWGRARARGRGARMLILYQRYARRRRRFQQARNRERVADAQ